ncbi:MAG TPA: hypothetical protein PLO61_11295 [Fimbriimonadaceae bacterium]|nr:hypothetical protein [Fimbriimonadaceae bacterium]HRJ34262.1 hypothetical protein [Fimbriimonadaceae bacterium]
MHGRHRRREILGGRRALIALGLASVLAAGLLAPQSQTSLVRRVDLPDPFGGPSRTLFQVNMGKLEPPKFCPKDQLVYPFIVAGYGERIVGSGQKELRFRVFSQDRETAVDEEVMRMLLRLWETNVSRLRLDHSELYNRRIVDVYLQRGGKPGGEHLFDEDEEGGIVRKVNTIYIYDLATFKDPVEKAREVAHEYGHAALPPIGTYREPEDWANGPLGERIYLTWLAEELEDNRLGPIDVMGATAPQIRAWIQKNVVPDRDQFALKGLDLKLLGQNSAAAMNAYLGLATWAQAILPERAFARSLILTGSQKATDYAKAVVEAAREQREWVIDPPRELRSKPIWIPLAKGTLSGGSVDRRQGDWALVRLSASGTAKITNPPID